MSPEQVELLRAWAEAQIEGKQPEFRIPGPDTAYLLRWEPSEALADDHVYIHRIVDSEPPEAMHDHPWENASVILAGRYIEHTPERAFIREPGDVIYRAPEEQHRMELNPGETCLTLFVTGDMVRLLREGNFAEMGLPAV